MVVGLDDARRLFVYVAHEKIRGALIGTVSLSHAHPEIGRLGFQEIGLHRIGAYVAVENMANRRVVEKVGMKYEGTARDCIWTQGR